MTTGLTPQPVSSPDRVLLLAADDSLVHELKLALSAPRFEIRQASSRTAGDSITRGWNADLAIVDLDWAPRDTLDWVAQRAPTIAITRSYEMAPKLRAFDHGADDVVLMPFAPNELLARAAAILRRTRQFRGPSGARLHIGDLTIDLVRRRATLRHTRLELTPVERSLLYVLASNPGKVLDRDDLHNAVWGAGHQAASNLVDRHISNVRIKLGDDPRAPRLITTVARRGYRFDPAAESEIRSFFRIHPDWFLCAGAA